MQDTPDDAVEARPHFHERRRGAVRTTIASHRVAHLVRQVQDEHPIANHDEKTAENAKTNVVRARSWACRVPDARIGDLLVSRIKVNLVLRHSDRLLIWEQDGQ